MQQQVMAYHIPPLRFDYDALEPHIKREVMIHHHKSVHPAYLSALNALLVENPDCGRDTVEALLRGLEEIPVGLRQQVAHLAGGHANHQFFWKVLGPQGLDAAPATPVGNLAGEIDRAWGSFDRFRTAFTDAALSLSTEGWAFLSLSKPKSGDLEIVVLPGNGSVLPIAKPGILICDLWNHHSKNNHEEWLEAFWHVVDWNICEYRYQGLRDGKAVL